MEFKPSLEKGRFIKRYKRFLCDVCLSSGEEITIHCPNTGSMKNCCFDDAPVWFSRSDNVKRKYPCTWEMIKSPAGHLIGINTGRANQLVIEAIENNKIPLLVDFKNLRREVKYGEENSRIDIFLESAEGKYAYIEVKSVTLLENKEIGNEKLENDGCGYFPDSISERAQKHLRELMWVQEQGHQAILFFCVQHSGIRKVKAAKHIDKQYALLLEEALKKGVKVLAYACDLNEQGITLVREIAFELS